MNAGGSGKPVVYVKGMGGLGDNIHQRALVRQWIEHYDLWLETPWPTLYHDFVHQGLKLKRQRTELRTQAKNIVRQAVHFTDARPPGSLTMRQVWWRPYEVKEKKSVLASMMSQSMDPDRDVGERAFNYEKADFRLPVSPSWLANVERMIHQWKPQKPIMVYRPLTIRPEWAGSKTRNPDPYAYWALYDHIFSDFFVVSIADLEKDKEWIISHSVRGVDVELHKGELTFEDLVALFSLAALVYTSPGFAVPLAQAVSTPVISIVGGYEASYSFSCGARWCPYLGIDPINPCVCFLHHHRCAKEINIPEAREKVTKFAQEALAGRTDMAACA